MTADELRSAILRESFRGHPGGVEAALDRWADLIDQRHRLDRTELTEQKFSTKFRGYDPDDVQALIKRLVDENT